MRLHRVIGALSVALSLLSVAPANHAHARKHTEYRYPFKRVWNSAVRMVRVDMRMPVTDRDPDAGYMLFEYIDGERRYPGSIELVSNDRGRLPVVRAVITVEGMPSYVEQMLLDKLERKLEAEYGAPMEPPKEAPPSEAPAEPPGDAPDAVKEPEADGNDG